MYQDSFFGSVKRGYLNLPIAIRVIISINIVVFLIQALAGSSANQVLVNALAFYPEWQTTLFQPWRLLTYMFMHAGGFHLLFNMLWLWWLGRVVEETLGPRTFTTIYLGSGIGGALLDVAFAQLLGINFVIGASGAVFGIMVAFAMLYPKMPIMLFLLPPIEARYVVAGLIALDLLFIGSSDNTARIVHLGGAGIGYLLMKLHKGGADLTGWTLPFLRIYYRLKGAYSPGVNSTKKQGRGKRTAGGLRSVTDVEIMEEEEVSELDDILEKISKKGYDGLTRAEKKKLFDLSKRKE